MRDAADIYMSLKYPPTVFINDTPCGLVRHMEIRCPEFSKQMWSDRRGCFERPNMDSEPHAVSTFYLILFYFAQLILAQMFLVAKLVFHGILPHDIN